MEPFVSYPFEEYSEEDLKERIVSLEDVIEQVGSMLPLLKHLDQIEDEEVVSTLKEAIRTRINKIEESTGFESFVQAFQIKFFDNGESQRPPLAEIIYNLRSDLWPSVKWPIGKQYIYSNELEENYERLTPESNKRIVDIKKEIDKIDAEIIINPIHELTIEQLLNPVRSPRAFEFLKLFLLDKVIELRKDENMVKTSDMNKVKNNQYDEWENVKYKINSQFEKYYNSIYSDNKKNLKLPTKIDCRHYLWKDFFDKTIELRDQILKISRECKSDFTKYMRIVENDLTDEIFQFSLLNNIDAWTLPSARQLQKYKGGAGLAKRINAIGLEKMKDLYNTYIKDNKLKSQKTWNPSEQKPSTSKNIWDPDNLPNWGDEIPF